MNRLALLLLLFALPVLAGEAAYRIVHPDGTVEYTDEPPVENGAESIPLPEIQTYEAPPPPRLERPEAAAPKEDDSDRVEYSLKVTQPDSDEHIWVSDWRVPIGVNLSPGLEDDHEIVVTVDGAEVGRGKRTRFTVSPIYRGEHQVSARVVDESGNVLSESEPVTFYIHKHQVNRP
ncbi:DUF4124 domain-containing protein [Thiohalomonas denitrificans]|uniref:DUF4124 domain-containing protein n=1 Tax=Thiohalomonas denitrificans TaxID=415747 RepID=A0A1G5QVR5_9GAMM|nr:DUF4124 domain-containing protein [Thiohalomonas denitrificans]SCZ65189.1 protein of unknown function [Thiohalomonas denitrificans]